MPLAFAHTLVADHKLLALGWGFLILGWVKLYVEIMRGRR
jgi:hypothetical protein